MLETTPETLAFLSQELKKLSDSDLALVLNAHAPSHGLAYQMVCNLSEEEQGILFEGLLMAFGSELWEDRSLAERITDRGEALSRWAGEEVDPENLLRRVGDASLASAIDDKAGTVSEWLARNEVSVFID